MSMGARVSLVFAPPGAGTQQAGGKHGKKGGEKRVLIPIYSGATTG